MDPGLGRPGHGADSTRAGDHSPRNRRSPGEELSQSPQALRAKEGVEFSSDQQFKVSRPSSLSENGEEFCLGEKGSIGKARGGSRPAAVCDRQATPPAGPSLPNPSGGGSFRLGLRWFGRNRPQEVCPAAHRLAQPRIPQPQNRSPFSDRLLAGLGFGSLGAPPTERDRVPMKKSATLLRRPRFGSFRGDTVRT